MNILPIIASVAMAASTFRPTQSFADLMKQGTVLGTGTFSATIIAGKTTPMEIKLLKKPAYTIAFLGDSMIDTLGSDLRLVHDELARTYPKTNFTLLNYGVGGENIVSGLERVTRDTVYLGLPRPALILTHPDVVIIESFAYNPFSFDTGALEQHWLSLSYIVDALKVNLPETKIVFAATIAPNSKVFGDGALGLSFSPQDKKERTKIIKQYLENTIRFAKSEHVPLADVYQLSIDNSGEGKLAFISPGDHIHYSDLGRQLFAQTVVDTIVANKLLE